MTKHIGNVVGVNVYPVKGLAGIPTPERGLHVRPDIGVVGDRTFAIHNGDGPVPTGWTEKKHLKVCMNTEGMATANPLTEDDLGDDGRLDPERAWEVIKRRGLVESREEVIETGEYWNMADTPGGFVSFLNLATLHALEVHLGVEIDPARFRMNVLVAGLPPFAEIWYVTRFGQPDAFPMHVGDLELGIHDMCERCRAVEQDPETGRFDHRYLAGLRDLMSVQNYPGSPQRGRLHVMGWYARPKHPGIIKLGQRVTLG